MADNEMPTADDPLWYKDAVIYQLHIKSFFDANDDGIGDFPGLMQKLDYIAALGVTAIWLLPFYPSPRRDDGYDIAEYRDVSPDYGVFDDVKRFIEAAHERGIRVITELVINHTSDQHPWFQRARHAPPGSPERDFYVWSDNDHAYSGTRIIFLDTEKSNWTWDPVAGAYFWHRFYSHQPDLNFDNPAVLEEVLATMRFWLDLGIDGLRLDAIPYLIEREGTNNENLPETHDVLKKIRAALDASYPDRMLLAEANQWPEDTQEYFGAGDECHMAFHFPLMPRMYMAIAKEDRFPITDIMRQTPEIPANCQWAIFLRNHDELTLEMVTDSERDYLWEVYASDRRARINLGIRRRLAPLLERDRRRIELMDSLLFSMPGTPVIYYGDEIGMGDNIHLGDRDGVRTPMQWSPDRNGGFSKADPERLVLPAISNALYGYEAVNVEAQHRDPHSLLNWTRRFIAMRKRHKAFGRGSLRFLYPGNRKVLAYLREFEDETILCVANLSRAPQAVELDLSTFEKRVPVEMLGGSIFPPIGQLTYLLTLPPYGFYSFQLAEAVKAPTWHAEAPEPMPEYQTLVLRQGMADIVRDPRHRPVLERDVLPAYLGMRRWFAGKDERLKRVRIGTLSPIGEDMLLAEIEADVGERTERYLLPLGIAWEAPNLPALPQRLALARVRRGSKVGFLTDAFSLEAVPRGIVAALMRGDAVPSDGGEFRFLASPQLAELEPTAETEVRWLSAEQSNSSAIIDDQVVVKLIRRIIPGIHPEAEMTRRLTAAGVKNVPALLGEVVRVDKDGVPATVGIVQAFVRNQGDAWGWTLDYLRRSMEETGQAEASDDLVDDSLRGYEAFAGAIGRRLAEVHLALATPSEDPAFAPERLDAARAEVLGEEIAGELDTAMQRLAEVESWPDEASRLAAESLLARREALAEAARRLAAESVGTLLTRVHGDFHLGQVLVVQSDAYIVDFEGEPVRSLEERRAKSSPMRDVAGLIRSFDYAGAALEGSPGGAQLAPERREALLERFRERAEAAFLAGYDETAGEAPWMEQEDTLLALYLLAKAAYEVRYEAANRPAWIGLPTRGLARVAGRLLGVERMEAEPSDG